MKKHTFLTLDEFKTIDFKGYKMSKKLRIEKMGDNALKYYDSYYEMVSGLDIETSSFNVNNNKSVITYAIAVNVEGYCVLLREWHELNELVYHLQDMLNLSYDPYDENNLLVMYIHNLGYEFQFIKKVLTFDNVFCNGSERKILKATCREGIEFRCSMMLSGTNLERMAKNLTKYKVRKMKGDLDYSLIRTPKTPLTKKELGYILNDVVIIELALRERLENERSITSIPLTSTGYVRRHARKATIGYINRKITENTDPETVELIKESRRYHNRIMSLRLEVDEYKALRFAFSGGFTHANVSTVTKTIEDVKARDFASSYPARMIAYEYPMSKGEKYECYTKDDFFNQIDTYCCLFYVNFYGLKRIANEGYISHSKAIRCRNVKSNNGRVEEAEEFGMWLTDVDFKCIMMSYDVVDFDLGDMWRYKKGYLPTELIDVVIDLYEKKTMYKNVVGKEAEYNSSKEMLNSVYGMIVQDIIQEEFEWDSEIFLNIKQEDIEYYDKIQKYNGSIKRFLYYPWGVWVTAYARYDLFSTIVELGDNYHYADTDSIYYTNDIECQPIFDRCNERIIRQLKAACEFHDISYGRLCPKDPDGETHTIGLWSFDGEYTRFKTLGAKRYMVEKWDSKNNTKAINITVSGVNKSSAVPYLIKTYGDDIFDAFNDGLHIPEGACGKSTHTYIEYEMSGVVKDYLGVECAYYEKSGVHLEETSYAMTLSDEYREFIEWNMNKE